MNYLQKELYELTRNDDKIFEFIQHTTQDGMWYWDLERPENEWMNPVFWKTLGYDPSKKPHKISAWKEIVNEEARLFVCWEPTQTSATLCEKRNSWSGVTARPISVTGN
jgi:hypothetical protein